MAVTHRALVLHISALYVGLITMMRLTVDATSETHHNLYRMIDYANDLYDQMTASSSAVERFHMASMSLAVYNLLADTEHVSRIVVDRLARCDVHRRRKRLQRIIQTHLETRSGSSSDAREFETVATA